MDIEAHTDVKSFATDPVLGVWFHNGHRGVRENLLLPVYLKHRYGNDDRLLVWGKFDMSADCYLCACIQTNSDDLWYEWEETKNVRNYVRVGRPLLSKIVANAIRALCQKYGVTPIV